MGELNIAFQNQIKKISITTPTLLIKDLMSVLEANDRNDSNDDQFNEYLFFYKGSKLSVRSSSSVEDLLKEKEKNENSDDINDDVLIVIKGRDSDLNSYVFESNEITIDDEIERKLGHLDDAERSPVTFEIPPQVINSMRGPQTMISLVKTFMAISRELQPDVEDDIKETIDEEIDEDFDPYADIQEDSMIQLQDMGFTRESVQKALVLNRLSPSLATDWLLRHSGDESLEEPLTKAQLKRIQNQRREDSENSVDDDACAMLTAMGFSLPDVQAALRICDNNQQTACDLLLGDRHINDDDEDEDGANDFEKAEIYDLEHPYVTALLNDQKIKNALTNPAVYNALKQVSQKQSTVVKFIMDKEIAPVLVRLTQIVEETMQETMLS